MKKFYKIIFLFFLFGIFHSTAFAAWEYSTVENQYAYKLSNPINYLGDSDPACPTIFISTAFRLSNGTFIDANTMNHKWDIPSSDFMYTPAGVGVDINTLLNQNFGMWSMGMDPAAIGFIDIGNGVLSFDNVVRVFYGQYYNTQSCANSHGVTYKRFLEDQNLSTTYGVAYSNFLNSSLPYVDFNIAFTFNNNTWETSTPVISTNNTPTATCTDGIQNQDETGIDVGGVCGTPPPPAATCTDGIQNQDETGIDVGGVCFYVSLNWPENSSQVPDFLHWTTAYYGNDANGTSPTLQQGVIWSDNHDLLNTCKDFPNGMADYATCFTGTNVIHIDYGVPLWISTASYVENIEKTGTMLAGKTYYARAVLYAIDDTTLTRADMVSFSDIISFRIDNTIGTGGATGSCQALDLGCIFKAVIQWAFLPTAASLSQFSDFKILLEQKAPFGYAKQIYDSLTVITYNANETKIVVLQQVTPITNQIFTPIKTGLTWLLWFSFLFYLYKRFKDIQI